MRHISTTPELKVFWNKFSLSYLKTSSSMNSLFATMCNVSIIDNEKKKIENILEMACGGGKGLIHLSEILKNEENVNIYGTDLASNMLDIAYNNISKKADINLEYKNYKNNFKENKQNICLFECDNQNMLIFPDKKFDVILSNNSLQLVTDPNKMLREAYRLLKDDGVACFTTWGRPENSFIFTLIPNTLKKMNVSLPNVRSNFHLSKETKLAPLLKDNGFNKFNLCNIYMPFQIFKPEDFYYYFDAPIYEDIMNKMDEKAKVEFYKEINREILNKLEKNEFIGAEFILIKCSKI